MTFADLLSAFYEECNYLASPASAVVTRAKRLINEGQRMVLSEPGLVRLADSDGPYTFATVASTARYVVPESVARILHMRETTNDITLRGMSLAAYRHADADPASSSGTPTHYVPIGRVAVATQPSNASEIFVDSTDAGDTGTAYLESIITGGYMRSSSATMSGVTAVSFSSSLTTVIEITDFYLATAAVGRVTLHEDASGGTELASISPGAKRPRYYGFYLWPTPSAAVTYSVDYRREIVELVNDTDEPTLPTDVHPMLVAYAVAREKEKTGDTDGFAQAMARYQKFLTHLKYQTQTMSDEIPVIGRGNQPLRSRLGAWFPASHWS